MREKTLTTRELFAAAGVKTNSVGSEIPTEYRHLLIASVLECLSAETLRNALSVHGVKVPLRSVSEWQIKTRDWLGLPPARPGKPSAEYLQTIREWKEANGNPTWEEIDSGWVPAHHREKEGSAPRQLSASFQRQIEAFRSQMTLLNSAKNDDEVRNLLTQFLEEMGKAWQIPSMATHPQPDA